MAQIVYLSVALTIIVIVAIIYKSFNRGKPPLTKGGSVNNKKYRDYDCDCDDREPIELRVSFVEPLEINVNVNIISPEPVGKVELALGPVREKDKVK